MDTKKLAATFAILMIALSVAGFVYAAWRDYVYIEGTVHMGEFIVGIYAGSPTDLTAPITVVETTNGYPEGEKGHDFVPKPWVANTTVTLSKLETSKHHEPPQTVAHVMDILIENAYPQYDVHISGKLKNAGTIPAKATLCVFRGYDKTDDEDLRLEGMWVWNESESVWVFDGKIWDNGADNQWDTNDDVVIINLKMIIKAPEDMQLEPCHEYPFTIDIDFKQEAEECHTYTFSAGFEFIQWNKYGIPEQD
ncbi:MAG: hypothetical protein QXR89_00130 [Candidatus Bathyarchaeia archaeon]